MTNYSSLSSMSDEELIIGAYCKRNEFANNSKTEEYFKLIEAELIDRGYTPSVDMSMNEWWQLIIQRKSNIELVSLLNHKKIGKIARKEIARRRLPKETIKFLQKEIEEIGDMFMLNGIGTTLYGHADELSDGSYVATKWFAFFFIPIFPIKSYRVLSKKGGFFDFSKEYHLKCVMLNKKQIVKTYLVSLGILLFIYLIILCA